jgi:hypothetical protein
LDGKEEEKYEEMNDEEDIGLWYSRYKDAKEMEAY